MTQQEFQQKLTAVLARAEERNLRIEKGEVERFFDGEELSDEQMKLVFDYLLSKKIVVEGYLKAAVLPELSPEDLRYLEEYEETLSVLAPEKAGEKEMLLKRLQAGDSAARERLSELFLPQVVQAAREMYVQEVLISDLIQEGNLNLLLALEELAGGMELEPGAAERRILQAIRQGMQALSEEQKDVRHQDSKMVTKVQDLKDSVAILKEEMGRKVYLDEVADFMNISEEEAEAILKLAGEEVPPEE